MRALNILHTEASPGLGGQEKRILLEAVVLEKRGHRVHIAGQPHGLIRKEAEEAGLSFHPIRMRTSWDPAALFRLICLIRKIRPHLIHTHSSKDSWLAGVAGRLMGVPVVRTRHVSIPVSGNALNWVYLLPKRIFTTADLIRRMLIEQKVCKGDRVSVLPTGVDLSAFHDGVSGEGFRAEFGLSGETPAVGIIAQLRKSKGHDHFLAAARILRDRGVSARFFVVGDGHWRDIFREEAERLGLLGGTVRFLGYRTDIPQIMAGLDLLVIASTRTEGIPQVALQAMAMRLPVVGTDIGGVPEAILPGGAGVVVPPGDPEALAAAIEEMLADPERRRRMGESGKKYVTENHSLTRMIEETERLYNEVLAA
ncbi:MAG: glycosyltransferase family 4 protein [bacterium]|nr:glycosyltransferase family 4 protein [bacterium]